jgi:hypothetical protein
MESSQHIMWTIRRHISKKKGFLLLLLLLLLMRAICVQSVIVVVIMCQPMHTRDRSSGSALGFAQNALATLCRGSILASQTPELIHPWHSKRDRLPKIQQASICSPPHKSRNLTHSYKKHQSPNFFVDWTSTSHNGFTNPLKSCPLPIGTPVLRPNREAHLRLCRQGCDQTCCCQSCCSSSAVPWCQDCRLRWRQGGCL